jgi:hypothetical protein
MAQAAGIVLVAGSITAANELLFAPAAGVKASFSWRVIPATAGLALALTGVEKLAPKFGTGLAWLTLAAVLVVPTGKAPSPVQNVTKALGYSK